MIVVCNTNMLSISHIVSNINNVNDCEYNDNIYIYIYIYMC